MRTNNLRRVIVLMLGALLLLLVAAASPDTFTRVFLPWVSREQNIAYGTLEGVVRVGPLCPVEPCPQPTPDVYSSRSLVLARKEGSQIKVTLASDGTFRADVPATEYEVNLTDCTYLGCRYALPKHVTVAPRSVTELVIDIDTGIR